MSRIRSSNVPRPFPMYVLVIRTMGAWRNDSARALPVGRSPSRAAVSRECRRPTRTPSRMSGVSCVGRSEEHTSELQSLAYLVCRLLLEKKKKHQIGLAAQPIKHKALNDYNGHSSRKTIRGNEQPTHDDDYASCPQPVARVLHKRRGQSE